MVRGIVDRFNGRSAMDGTSAERMCIVRYFVDVPITHSPWNAVLLTSTQARHLPRCREARARCFPVALQEEMRMKNLVLY